jgi:histidine triad (HIT) family protein
MSYDPQNVFARILRGELPCIRLFEDEYTLAFMDLMPQTEGHTLVITREPAETLFELSPEGASACMRTTQHVAAAVKRAFDAPGIMITQVNGAAAGQTVHMCTFTSFRGVPGKSCSCMPPSKRIRKSCSSTPNVSGAGCSHFV